jgi:hypothetical protein
VYNFGNAKPESCRPSIDQSVVYIQSGFFLFLFFCDKTTNKVVYSILHTTRWLSQRPRFGEKGREYDYRFRLVLRYETNTYNNKGLFYFFSLTSIVVVYK